RAGEASVGDEDDGLAEAGADHGRSDAQHLAHPWAARWAFVANHEHVAGSDAARPHAVAARLFAVEDARRAAMTAAARRRDFDERALRRKVAAKRVQRAGRLERLLEGVDDLAVRARCVVRGLRERPAVDGWCVPVDVPAADELADHGSRTACALEVLPHPATRRPAG